MLKKVKTKQIFNKVFRINSLLPDARRCNSPTGKTDYQTGEAGNNGGHSEPDRESLLAEIGMSKVHLNLRLNHRHEQQPTQVIRLGQKARIKGLGNSKFDLDAFPKKPGG